MQIMNGPVLPMQPRNKGGRSYEIKAKGQEGEIWLYDVIGDSWEGTTGKQFAADLKALGNVETLNVYINSEGGSVFDGVAIHNVLKRHRARKVVHIDGLAASIASVIAMAGDEIRIASNGMMMIHDPWAQAMGTAGDFRKMAEALDKVGEAILASYVERTTTGEDRLQQWMADETWFTATEAVDAGLADTITDEVAMAAFAKLNLSAFRRPPDALKQAVADAPADDHEEGAPHPAVSTMKARLIKHGLDQQATA